MASAEERKAVIKKAAKQVRSGNAFLRPAAEVKTPNQEKPWPVVALARRMGTDHKELTITRKDPSEIRGDFEGETYIPVSALLNEKVQKRAWAEYKRLYKSPAPLGHAQRACFDVAIEAIEKDDQ